MSGTNGEPAVCDGIRGMTGRIEREKETLKAMMRIYCRDKHHRNPELCEKCSSLLDYAYVKLDKCPFHRRKPQCSECSVHCYQPQKREEVREVMRYSGPRMLFSHPVLAALHIIDGYLHKPVSLREFRDPPL